MHNFDMNKCKDLSDSDSSFVSNATDRIPGVNIEAMVNMCALCSSLSAVSLVLLGKHDRESFLCSVGLRNSPSNVPLDTVGSEYMLRLLRT